MFARRPIFGYKGLVLATLSIAALSTSVWAHHMFVTGKVVLPFFAATSFLIAVPTGVKVFNWIGTMWGGSLTFESPMLFSIGFLVTFVGGGLTGVMLASPSLDFQLSDSYFVVAHLHYVMGGTVIFAMFAAIYFWWPKVTGRFLSERLARVHFWLLIDRVQRDVPVHARARPRGHAAPGRRLRGRAEPRTMEHDRVARHDRADGVVRAVRDRGGAIVAHRTHGRRRPVAGELAGMGHLVTAAAPQLRVVATDQVGAPGVRPAMDRAPRRGPARDDPGVGGAARHRPPSGVRSRDVRSTRCTTRCRTRQS